MTFLLTIAEADEKMLDAMERYEGDTFRIRRAAAYRSAIAARPSICSDYWKAMREVVEAGECLARRGGEISDASRRAR